jgi:hypothetical protein
MGSPWAQQGSKLTGGGETGAGWFGRSVALSADGQTALIGGPYDNSSIGAAWAFVNPSPASGAGCPFLAAPVTPSRASGVSLTGLAARRPALSFKLSGGLGAPGSKRSS